MGTQEDMDLVSNMLETTRAKALELDHAALATLFSALYVTALIKDRSIIESLESMVLGAVNAA